MGLFGGKPNHSRSVELLIENSLRLWRAMKPDGGTLAVDELQFERNDSAFRLLVFCTSAVHYACASKMSNPDAVLNEAISHMVAFALEDQDGWFGGPVDPQDAASRTAILQDFLNRWSSYKDVKVDGDAHIATAMVATMLREVESTQPAPKSAKMRLMQNADSVEKLLELARGRFK